MSSNRSGDNGSDVCVSNEMREKKQQQEKKSQSAIRETGRLGKDGRACL